MTPPTERLLARCTPTRADGPQTLDESVRNRLRRQGRRDTEPEIELRRRLHAMGFRYRVDHPVVPGTRRRVDIAFTAKRVAVMVDGCFWHSCPEHGDVPENNRAWWRAKLIANVERDRDTDRRLRDAGWAVVRVWEHEDMDVAADRVVALLQARH